MKKILLPLLLASCLNVYSQVYNAGTMFPVYYDINPDTLLNYTLVPYTNETYDLDLFAPASNDIELKAFGAASSGGSGAYISATSLNPNVYIRFGRLDSVYVTGSSNWDVTKVAAPLNMGDPINPGNAVWDNGTLYLTDHSGHSGGNKNVNDWIGGDKYLGLKYQNGSTITYGWIRVRCKTEDSCYVKDFSYSTIAIGIQEIRNAEVLVYPNPANSVFFLKGISINVFDISRLKVQDMYGKEVAFTSEMKGDEIKINLDHNLSVGCYLLQYFSNDYTISKKLIKLTE